MPTYLPPPPLTLSSLPPASCCSGVSLQKAGGCGRDRGGHAGGGYRFPRLRFKLHRWDSGAGSQEEHRDRFGGIHRAGKMFRDHRKQVSPGFSHILVPGCECVKPRDQQFLASLPLYPSRDSAELTRGPCSAGRFGGRSGERHGICAGPSGAPLSLSCGRNPLSAFQGSGEPHLEQETPLTTVYSEVRHPGQGLRVI